MKTNQDKILRTQLFQSIKQKQPYTTSLLDIDLLVADDVFPPEYGATTLHLANAIKKYAHVKTGLDMGCGTGFLALMMRKCGIPSVWATDNHEKAIHCTVENIRRNATFAPIQTAVSDLFSSLSTNHPFDLIVFNHPYYPNEDKPLFGCHSDGGREILNRFFKSIRPFCHKDTKILLPFSSISESEHDPAVVAAHLKIFNVTTLCKVQDANGCHRIYEITSDNLRINFNATSDK